MIIGFNVFHLGLSENKAIRPPINTGKISGKSKDIMTYTISTMNKRTFVVPVKRCK